MSSGVLEQQRRAGRVVQEFLSRVDVDVEIVTVHSDTALTRFANSQIIQNTWRRETRVYLRVAVGDRWATAGTNAMDEDRLRVTLQRAEAAARASPPDPRFPGFAQPGEAGDAEGVRRFDEGVESVTPRGRADAVRTMLESTGNMNAAGYVETGAHSYSISSTTGMDRHDAFTKVAVQNLVELEGATGWGEAYSHRWGDMDFAAVARRAAAKATSGVGAREADPGTYEVVLEPAAVATMVDFLSWMGFGAKSVIDGESFLAERVGLSVAAPCITIRDDVRDPSSIGIGFDLEGVSRRSLSLIDEGRALGPVTDRRTAAELGLDVTGHSTGSVEYGPLASNVVLEPGDRSLRELIGDTAAGFLVTRFHYVNILDRPTTLLTGMTRDGTFRIRNGDIVEPVRNFRFTQSVLEALRTVRGVGSDPCLFSESFGSTSVPALHVGEFTFSSTTTH